LVLPDIAGPVNISARNFSVLSPILARSEMALIADGRFRGEADMHHGPASTPPWSRTQLGH